MDHSIGYGLMKRCFVYEFLYQTISDFHSESKFAIKMDIVGVAAAG